MYTLGEIISKTGCADNPASRRAMVVGFIVQEMMASNTRRSSRLETILASLDPAIELEQNSLFFDHAGRFVGYVCWARVGEAVARRLLTESDFSLSWEDRQSGSQLWITDLAVSHGYLRAVLARLRDALFSDVDQVTYFRVKGSKKIAKRIHSRNGHAFFRQGIAPV